MQLKRGGLLLNQIISSAIGNIPEGNLTLLKLMGTPVLAVADAHFHLRVHHERWVMDPNYAIFHINPPARSDVSDAQLAIATGRPVIVAELFSKNKHVVTE